MIDQVQTCGRRSFIACAASGLLLAALAPRGAAATSENGPTPAGPTPAPAAEPVRSIDELGVDLMMVRLDASEFLIDLRYRIKDTAKAQPLLEQLGCGPTTRASFALYNSAAEVERLVDGVAQALRLLR